MPNVHPFPSALSDSRLAPRRAIPRLSSVLVHAGLSVRSDRRIEAAAELANVFGARLIGVSTPAAGATPSSPFAGCGPSAIESEAIDRLLEAAGLRFATLSAAVRGGFHWERMNASSTEALGALGAAADLILVDHADAESTRAWSEALEDLLASGRPVLVRADEDWRWAFERIVLVWDESVACRRAIAAALPLLGRARDITLLAPPWRRKRDREEQQLEAARHALLARGLPVAVARLQEWSAPHVLIPHLQAADADLVVMAGVQEHVPWRGRTPASEIAAHLHGPVLVAR